MSFRTQPHLRGQQNTLYLLIGLATGIWILIYKFVGDRLVLRFLSPHARETIRGKKRSSPNFDRLCRINGTGFIHALLVGPLMLLVLWQLRDDRWNGESLFYDVAAVIVSGYFIWDMYICVTQYNQFGFSFLVHGLICLSCMMFQHLATDMRTSFVLAGMISTEMSTIFLHLRWFLIQGKAASTGYFKIVNALFMATFISFRLLGAVFLNILPYITHVLTARNMHLGTFDTFRIYYQVFVSVLWVILQYYWGYSVGRSQIYHLWSRIQIKRK